MIAEGLLAAGGLTLAFFGRRLLHGMARVYGLLAGVILSATAMPTLVVDGGLPSWTLWAVIGLAAVLGFLVGRELYFVWIFTTAAGAVPAVAWNLPIPHREIVMAAVGVLAGILAIKFEAPLMKAATAMVGAVVAGVAGCELAGAAAPWPWILAGALALGGLVTQFRRNPPAERVEA